MTRSLCLLVATSGLLGSLAACPKAPPLSSKSEVDLARQAIHIPPGCQTNLSGQYTHEVDPSYRYVGSDDGGTLILRVLRAFDDAGLGEVADAGTAVVLRREPGGFIGAVYAQGFLPSASCEVRFPTEIVACDDAGIVVSSLSKASVDERCQTAKGTPESNRADDGATMKHRLLRER